MFLVYFTAFIQFMAGLGLLFSYENVIKKSPLSGCGTKAANLISGIYLNYSSYISDELDEYIEKNNYLIDASEPDSEWGEFTRMICVYGSLTMMYSLLLLVFVGYETLIHPFVDIYSLLGVVVLLSVHSLIVLFTHKSDFGKAIILNSVLFLIAAFIVYFAQIGYKACYGSLFQLTHADCVTCIVLGCLLPTAIICVILLIGYFKIKHRIRKARRLENLLEVITQVLIGQGQSDKLPKDTKERMNRQLHEKREMQNQQYTEFLKDDIRERLERFFRSC